MLQLSPQGHALQHYMLLRRVLSLDGVLPIECHTKWILYVSGIFVSARGISVFSFEVTRARLARTFAVVSYCSASMVVT